MNDETRQKLSAYLDGGLPAAEAAALELQIAKSPELLKELEELKAVSKLLKDLPREPLPTGFLQRLERRRAAGDAPSERQDWVFLHPTYRPVAAALSGFIVALVVWDKVADKSAVVLPYAGIAVKTAADAPPVQFELADKVSNASQEAEAGTAIGGVAAPQFHPPSVEISEDDSSAAIVARRERARAKGSPILAEAVAPVQTLDALGSGGGAAASAPAALPAAPAPAKSFASVAATRGMAQSVPLSEEERSAKNEALYAALQSEKKRMGIAAIVAKDETADRAKRVLSAAGRMDQPASISSTRPALLGNAKALPGGPPPLRSVAAYQAAWASLLIPGQAPDVDFTTQMVVLLPEPGAVESAEESAGELVLSWRPTPGTPRERFAVVPASMLPVRLQRR
jgi:hypothetical protein